MPRSVSYALWSLETYSLGMKLRALRTKKRLTLSRLAAETGLSTALLSKLETDRMIPTLPTLATICKVYGVGLSHFFSEPERHTLSITRKAHMRSSQRGAEPARIIPLNNPTSDAKLHAQVVELSTGAPHTLGEAPGETCAVIHVLEGRLQFASGEISEVLEEGDCAYIDSTMTLVWSTAGKQPCRILVVRPGAKPSPQPQPDV